MIDDGDDTIWAFRVRVLRHGLTLEDENERQGKSCFSDTKWAVDMVIREPVHGVWTVVNMSVRHAVATAARELFSVRDGREMLVRLNLA